MRYEIAIGLLSAAILGIGWAWRRQRLAPAMAGLGRPAGPTPVVAIRRRPF